MIAIVSSVLLDQAILPRQDLHNLDERSAMRVRQWIMMHACYFYKTFFVCLLLVVPAMIVVITVLADPDSYGFHVMDKNNETL